MLEKGKCRSAKDRLDAAILQFGGLSFVSFSTFDFRCDWQIGSFIHAFGFHPPLCYLVLLLTAHFDCYCGFFIVPYTGSDFSHLLCILLYHK